MQLTQEDMMRALGLAPQKPKARPTSRPHRGITVKLSVKKAVGTTKTFIRTIPTLSTLEAECQAKQMARKAGWMVWCVLDVYPAEAEEARA
jgi:hypothetical protein